jgi:hypothetical protein
VIFEWRLPAGIPDSSRVNIKTASFTDGPIDLGPVEVERVTLHGEVTFSLHGLTSTG